MIKTLKTNTDLIEYIADGLTAAICGNENLTVDKLNNLDDESFTELVKNIKSGVAQGGQNPDLVKGLTHLEFLITARASVNSREIQV